MTASPSLANNQLGEDCWAYPANQSSALPPCWGRVRCDDDQGGEMLESDREKSHRWITVAGLYQKRDTV